MTAVYHMKQFHQLYIIFVSEKISLYIFFTTFIPYFVIIIKWAGYKNSEEFARKPVTHVTMTAAMVDILSEDHLERFYREHVAGKTSLDEDIRAIEEEIDK